ncbi:hypothetical protein C0674_12230 [Sporolactobacillus terrae]|uniref:Uncharacterized protein n=1 Tax=Sporolactobacillus terrae TaxID=269673 RepID=A0ABX5Q9K1_9BACL|nr:hypothetical protein C0674_12230 [Sporolactobacillus terrae]QAA26282.1 hypothetical protein C0679_12215 [Sporolactobacillus terrae]
MEKNYASMNVDGLRKEYHDMWLPAMRASERRTPVKIKINVKTTIFLIQYIDRDVPGGLNI